LAVVEKKKTLRPLVVRASIKTLCAGNGSTKRSSGIERGGFTVIFHTTLSYILGMKRDSFRQKLSIGNA